ncbi:hypothetical protein PHJA_001135400 [Phtheirospermum japonicum]|uniref:Uncharacterized protein n=1 Tax=Phtheirospermum japonicum TaxID=374723 RepID=A0A830BT01_9LAMI|nr:hypothetical protein PHJA_001135400 [Phtheirospermum japonicum]
MDVDALVKMFSRQEVNGKGKAKRVGKGKAKRGGGGKGEVKCGGGKRDVKIGPYYAHELAAVLDGASDDEGNDKVVLQDHPDDDKLVKLAYCTQVDGDFKGLSDALAAKSFEPGTRDHMKRFKRILEFQRPYEEEVRKYCRSVEQYQSKVILTAAGHVAFATFCR